MLTKEPSSSLKISMKMWENSVDAWKLTSTRSLGRVLIQIFTHTLSYPYMYTLQKLTILFINFVSFVPFGHWDFFFRQLQHLKEEGITLLGPQMKTGAIWWAFICWKVALLVGTRGASAVHTQSRRWAGGGFRYKDSPSNSRERHAQTVLRITGSYLK